MTDTDKALLREQFEKWITAPPFEKSVSRFPTTPSAAWWGAYRDYTVHLAWDAWKESARITAALSEKDEGGLKMHDPEGQRRCGFPPDDVIVDSETVYNVSDAQPLPPLPERK